MNKEKTIRTAAAAIMTEVLSTIDPGKTPHEKISAALMDAQHNLTDLLNSPETYKIMCPELERDIVSAISKLINIRYNINKIAPYRPCKFQN